MKLITVLGSVLMNKLTRELTPAEETMILQIWQEDVVPDCYNIWRIDPSGPYLKDMPSRQHIEACINIVQRGEMAGGEVSAYARIIYEQCEKPDFCATTLKTRGDLESNLKIKALVTSLLQHSFEVGK